MVQIREQFTTPAVDLITDHLMEKGRDGFEPPACPLADSRWLAYLYESTFTKIPPRYPLQVTLQGAPSEMKNTIALQKPMNYGEPTYLCLTGTYAGCIADWINPFRISSQLKAPARNRESFDGYVLRPLLAETQEIDSNFEEILQPFTQNSLSVLSPMHIFFGQLGIRYDREIFEQNVISFTQVVLADPS